MFYLLIFCFINTVLVRAACVRCHGTKCPLLTAFFLSLLFSYTYFSPRRGSEIVHGVLLWGWQQLVWHMSFFECLDDTKSSGLKEVFARIITLCLSYFLKFNFIICFIQSKKIFIVTGRKFLLQLKSRVKPVISFHKKTILLKTKWEMRGF